MVSAYVRQEVYHLLRISSITNGLCVCDAGRFLRMMQVGYRLLLISSYTNGLCISDAVGLSVFACHFGHPLCHLI